jgi:hypothetical protein
MHVVDGVSIKEIARRTGLARDTVRAAIRSDLPPSYERRLRPSKLDPFKLGSDGATEMGNMNLPLVFFDDPHLKVPLPDTVGLTAKPDDAPAAVAVFSDGP